jgi:hypothetical protein
MGAHLPSDYRSPCPLTLLVHQVPHLNPLLSKTVWRAVEEFLLTLQARRAVEQASLVVGMHPDQVRRASSPSRARPGAMRDPPCSQPEN